MREHRHDRRLSSAAPPRLLVCPSGATSGPRIQATTQAAVLMQRQQVRLWRTMLGRQRLCLQRRHSLTLCLCCLAWQVLSPAVTTPQQPATTGCRRLLLNPPHDPWSSSSSDPRALVGAHGAFMVASHTTAPPSSSAPRRVYLRSRSAQSLHMASRVLLVAPASCWHSSLRPCPLHPLL